MSISVKPVPDGVQAVIPTLVCRDVESLMNFCRSVFLASELVRRPDAGGNIVHAALSIHGAMIILQAEHGDLNRAPTPDGRSPVVIFVYVSDVDAALERATAAGAKVLIPIADQFWGDRTCRVRDPSGHQWTIASRIEETTYEERLERWDRLRQGESP